MLREGHLRIVLASLLGSIFVNLLFILGLSIMSAGLRKREQIYNQRVTQILVFFMTTGVLSLLIPVSTSIFAQRKLTSPDISSRLCTKTRPRRFSYPEI
jgi:calcium/proton exchanger cax